MGLALVAQATSRKFIRECLCRCWSVIVGQAWMLVFGPPESSFVGVSLVGHRLLDKHGCWPRPPIMGFSLVDL